MLCTGLDRVIAHPQLMEQWENFALVTHQAVTTSSYVPAVDGIFRACGVFSKKKTKGSVPQFQAIFGPQHGYYQTEQDNMKETPDQVYDLGAGRQLPIYSLYSQTRQPSAQQLENIQTLVVDLPDVGCRIYTYMLTLARCLKLAAQYKKKLVVLDRPNPMGLSHWDGKHWHRVEGNLWKKQWPSFVGEYPIPMRHGLTMGELGLFFKQQDNLELDYEVIQVDGLFRKQSTASMERECQWILPSPNLPQWKSTFFFPAYVMLEGVNISEGRGTTQPFQCVGAPYLAAQKIGQTLSQWAKNSQGSHNQLGGIAFRPHDFRPVFNKHSGQHCKGIAHHILDAEVPNLFALGLSFLFLARDNHPQDFRWTLPPYEYNHTDLPINLILGDSTFSNLSTQNELSVYLKNAHEEAQSFAAHSTQFHLYPDGP